MMRLTFLALLALLGGWRCADGLGRDDDLALLQQGPAPRELLAKGKKEPKVSLPHGAKGSWKNVDLLGAFGTRAEDGAPRELSNISDSESKDSGRGYVDVMVGACNHAHVMVGATVPFGAVVASPWTDKKDFDNWDLMSGFNNDARNPNFYGMAHLALSGAGWGALGVPRIMPLLPGLQGRSLALISQSIQASPGLFEADLALAIHPRNAVMKMRSSTTKRGAIHEVEWLQRDASTTPKLLEFSLKPTSNSHFELTDGAFHTEGFRILKACMIGTVRGFSTDFNDATITLCLHAEFDEDFEVLSGKQTMLLAFRGESNKVVARIGFSKSDSGHSHSAYLQELHNVDFDQVVKRSRLLWDEALGSVVADAPPHKKTMFYTALYHSMLSPNLHSDDDGTYILQKKDAMEEGRTTLNTLDKHVVKQRTEDDKDMYSTFSGWDTYRTLHPLLNLIRPKESRSFAASLLALGQAWGTIPRWQLGASPTDMMEGDPGSIIIGSMAVNGILDESWALEQLALLRAKKMADGRSCLEEEGCSTTEWRGVSAVLEQAKADFCVSHVAEKAGSGRYASGFRARASRSFRMWDKEQCIFAPVSSIQEGIELHQFRKNEKLNLQEGYREGTPLQYSFSAEHDVETLSSAFGGAHGLTCHLDYAFYRAPKPHTRTANMTANVGGVSVGNEPSFGTPYLAAKAGRPSLTQRILSDIMKRTFTPSCSGLPGNDDLGAMSSWIVFTMLGFYPLSPCSGEYVIGRPFLQRAEVKLEHGIISIRTHYQNFNKDNYVSRVTWNRETLHTPVLRFEQIQRGGLLEFFMSDSPNYDADQVQRGKSLTCDQGAGGPCADPQIREEELEEEASAPVQANPHRRNSHKIGGMIPKPLRRWMP